MLAAEFRTYLEIEKNYSDHTVAAYFRDLTSFQEFIQDTYEFDPTVPSELDSVTHRMIRSWMGEMIEEGLSHRTVARKMASLKAWYRWLLKTNRSEHNPAKKVTIPKFDQKLPSFVKDASIQQLFEKVEYPDTMEGARDRAVLEVLYSCGLRRSELIGLKYSNINWAEQTLKVMGKGRKERIVPFGSAARQSMEIYMQSCEDGGLNFRDHFFVKKDGKPMYAKLAYRIVDRYLKQACTLSKTSPHVLRHTFATHLLDRGADLNAIKELLGHSSLAATQVYVHNTIQKLKKVYDQAHPRA